eukprot:363316-Rhodomonas_salina.1
MCIRDSSPSLHLSSIAPPRRESAQTLMTGQEEVDAAVVSDLAQQRAAHLLLAHHPRFRRSLLKFSESQNFRGSLSLSEGSAPCEINCFLPTICTRNAVDCL